MTASITENKSYNELNKSTDRVGIDDDELHKSIKAETKDSRFYSIFAQPWKTKNGKKEEKVLGMMKIHWWFVTFFLTLPEFRFCNCVHHRY